MQSLRMKNLKEVKKGYFLFNNSQFAFHNFHLFTLFRNFAEQY